LNGDLDAKLASCACRKKTVTWTNEMIEDLIDFIEIHPIVAFEAIYEPILTSFWSLISFAVQLYIIMQYKGKHPPPQIDADKDSVF
jgi:hypothetical protein